MKPSSNSSNLMPNLLSSSITALNLSVSLKRSSLASLMTLGELPKAPSTARTGISSINRGMITSYTPQELKLSECFTLTLPIASPSVEVLSTSISAFICLNTSMMPDLVSLSETSSINISEPSVIAASTIKKAADDISPGTRTSRGFKDWLPCSLTVSPSTEISTQYFSSMISVLLRDLNSSCIIVAPSANRPENNIAFYTCALATGILYSMAFNAIGLIFIGWNLPSFKEMLAPISPNGPETRAIGLMAMELSPSIVAMLPRNESEPIRRRVGVPEFPGYQT